MGRQRERVGDRESRRPRARPERCEEVRVHDDFAEQLESAMRSQGVSRADLARMIGKDRASVTQALRSGSNLTMRTMIDMASALGLEVRVSLCPRRTGLP